MRTIRCIAWRVCVFYLVLLGANSAFKSSLREHRGIYGEAECGANNRPSIWMRHGLNSKEAELAYAHESSHASDLTGPGGCWLRHLLLSIHPTGHLESEARAFCAQAKVYERQGEHKMDAWHIGLEMLKAYPSLVNRHTQEEITATYHEVCPQ